jgi:hypothetical protein
MSQAARSLQLFGSDPAVWGAALAFAPNQPLGFLGMRGTSDVWIRVAGMLRFFLALCYRVAAQREQRAFFRSTVLTRSSVPLFCLVHVVARWARWPRLLFGPVDQAGAMWTHRALRRA